MLHSGGQGRYFNGGVRKNPEPPSNDWMFSPAIGNSAGARGYGTLLSTSSVSWNEENSIILTDTVLNTSSTQWISSISDGKTFNSSLTWNKCLWEETELIPAVKDGMFQGNSDEAKLILNNNWTWLLSPYESLV